MNFKTIVFLVLVFSGVITHAQEKHTQQSEVNGIISIHNSEFNTGKRQYVKNAQVEDKYDTSKATSVLTDVNGKFKLIYTGTSEKSTVFFKVRKVGLQVVNIDALSAVTGQKDTVRISLSHPDSIDNFRMAIYNIGKTEAGKKLLRQMEKNSKELSALKKSSKLDQVRIAQLEEQQLVLEEQREKVEEHARILSEKYEKINLDDATPIYREAFRLFKRGDIDSALIVINSTSLFKSTQKVIAEEKKINEVKKETKEREVLVKAEREKLIPLLLLTADWHPDLDTVEACYRSLVELDPINADYLISFGQMLKFIGKYDEAIQKLKKAESLLLNGKTSQNDLFKVYNELGLIYTHKVENTQAINYFDKAILLAINLYGANHQHLAVLYSNLGLAYAGKDEHDSAIAYFNKAMKLEMALGEKGNLNLAPIYNNLGMAYIGKEKYDSALVYYNKVLQWNKEHPGESSLGVAISYNNLARLYNSTNQQDLAIEYANKALTEFKKVFGESHPELAFIYDNLGLSYGKKGDYIKAEDYFNRALKMYREYYGEDHFTVGNAYNLLANFYSDQQDYDKALDYYHKSLKIISKSPLEYSNQIGSAYNNIGICYNYKGDHDKAIEYLNKAIETFTHDGTIHPEVAETYNRLGIVYLNIRDYDEVIKFCNKALEINKTRYGMSHPSIGTSYFYMALAYMSKGRNSEAIQCYKEALTNAIDNYGENSFEVAELYEKIALPYYNMNRLDYTIYYLGKAIEIYKLLSEENIAMKGHLNECYSSISVMHFYNENYLESIEVAKKAISLSFELKNTDEAVSSILTITRSFKKLGRCDSVLYYAEEGMRIALGKNRNRSILLNLQGDAPYKESLKEMYLDKALCLKAAGKTEETKKIFDAIRQVASEDKDESLMELLMEVDK